MRREDAALLERIQSENLPVKTFLAIVGCNQDEFETSMLQQVDATLPLDMPTAEVIARIRSVLARP
jgi:hypothetical protein